MDHKGKGIVINDKEKETFNIDEPKGDKPTDWGSNKKRKDRKMKRRIKKIIYYDINASSSSPKEDDNEDSSTKNKMDNILLIILASHIIWMLIYCLFHLASPLTLMGKIIHFGVIKYVVIYFLFILVFGK
jgi:hypothetical protein